MSKEEQGKPPVAEKDPLDFYRDVPVHLAVQMGAAHLKISELIDLAPGSIVLLNRQIGDPAELLANGVVIAQGEFVAKESALHFRVGEIVSPWEES
jgi:flagellar motor switch protein FliN/FliY